MSRSLISVLVLLVAPLWVTAQGFVSNPDRSLIDYYENYSLRFGSENYFLGYQPTYFEREFFVLQESKLIRSASDAWLFAGPLSHKAYAQIGLNFASQRSEPIRMYALGSGRYPVFRHAFESGSQGLPIRYKENFYADAQVSLPMGDHFFAKFDFNTGYSVDQQDQWAQVAQFYMAGRFRGLILSVGRQPLRWGQSFYGPLLFGDNAQNLDQIKLSTIPTKLPWILSYLGYFKTEIFFALMHDQRRPKDDKFLGWRVGIKPFYFLEMNAGIIYQFDGDEVTQASTFEYFTEFLGPRVVKNEAGTAYSNASNRAAQFDVRLSFDRLSMPFAIYSEHHLEDCCGNYKLIANKRYSYLYGGFLRLSKSPHALRFRLEYAKTIRQYQRNGEWLSAFSNFRRTFGNPVGRDSQGIDFQTSKSLKQLPISFHLWLQFREYLRSGALTDRGSVTAINPDYERSELRWSQGLGAEYFFAKKFRVEGFLGFHQIRHKAYESGRDAFEWSSALRFKYRL